MVALPAEVLIASDRLQGLDGFAGCTTVIKQTLLSNNGLFVLGLVAASMACALAAGDFKPTFSQAKDWLRGLMGEVLLGFGNLLLVLATLLSGIMAGRHLAGYLRSFVCSGCYWG